MYADVNGCAVRFTLVEDGELVIEWAMAGLFQECWLCDSMRVFPVVLTVWAACYLIGEDKSVCSDACVVLLPTPSGPLTYKCLLHNVCVCPKCSQHDPEETRSETRSSLQRDLQIHSHARLACVSACVHFRVCARVYARAGCVITLMTLVKRLAGPSIAGQSLTT